MRFDEHLLTNALALVRQSSGRTHPAPVDNWQSACVKDQSYKLTADAIAAVDEMGHYCDARVWVRAAA